MTLVDLQVSMGTPIGVAYGTDVGKVMGIRISCGEAIPMVLNSPKLTAVFLTFGG